jgi:hypothetical protein
VAKVAIGLAGGSTDEELGGKIEVVSRAASFNKFANKRRICNTFEVMVATLSDGCKSCRIERKVSGRCRRTWHGMEGNTVFRR